MLLGCCGTFFVKVGSILKMTHCCRGRMIFLTKIGSQIVVGMKVLFQRITCHEVEHEFILWENVIPFVKQ